MFTPCPPVGGGAKLWQRDVASKGSGQRLFLSVCEPGHGAQVARLLPGDAQDTNELSLQRWRPHPPTPPPPPTHPPPYTNSLQNRVSYQVGSGQLPVVLGSACPPTPDTNTSTGSGAAWGSSRHNIAPIAVHTPHSPPPPHPYHTVWHTPSKIQVGRGW